MSSVAELLPSGSDWLSADIKSSMQAAVGALIFLVSLSQYTFSERDDAVMLNERRALALAE